MSIFHLTVRSVSRASGRSAVAAAAYRAGERLFNARDGRVHDYTGKPVLEAFIMTPVSAPSWATDRSQLWNAVEATEKRKDAKVAREYELALPAELEAQARRLLTIKFAELLIERYGVAVDVALHPPDAEGDQRNYHAHLLTTTRSMTPEGLGPKTRQLDVSSKASVEVENLRASWAAMINSALERAQIPERVDHRSFERQGKLTEPTVKMGPVNTAIERRMHKKEERFRLHYPSTTKGEFNAIIKEIRSLTYYVEHGRAYIAKESKKIFKTAYKFTRATSQLNDLLTLQRIAGSLGRNPPRLRRLECSKARNRGHTR